MFISSTLRGVCILVSIVCLIDSAYSNELIKTLDLKQVLKISLANQPKIKAKLFQFEAKKAEATQVNLLINPDLELEFQDFGGSKNSSVTKSVETTASIFSSH